MSSKNDLHILIRKQRWDHVIARINLYPEESTIKIKHGVYSLPIHLACTRKPTLSTILAMIAADPRTLKVKDKIGRLPLHIAVRHRAHSKVVGVLLAAHPEGSRTQASDGSLPIHLACVYGECCQVLESLLGSYNASIRIRDGHGLLPKEVVADNPNLKVRSKFLVRLEQKSDITEKSNCMSASSTIEGIKSNTFSINRNCDTRTLLNIGKGYKRSESKFCVLCLEKAVNTVILPCGHLSLCSDCSKFDYLERIKGRCPECRQQIHESCEIFGRVVNDE